MPFSQAIKPIFRFLLKVYLKWITRIVLFIQMPKIIAVAGSTNKAFVREEVTNILLKSGKKVRANPKSFNTGIGLPLAILSLPSGYNSYRAWLPIIWRATTRLWQGDFPQYLVIELGVSLPGDMKYLLSIIDPNVVIITDITQRYLDAFSDMDRLAGEYEYLAKSLDADNLLILNHDNPRVRKIKKVSPARVTTFGLNSDADWQAVETEKTDNGQRVTVIHGRDKQTREIKRFGQHHIYALLAGLIIGDYAAAKKQHSA